MANTLHVAHVSLKAYDLFATPKDWAAIQNWIERHPKEDQIYLWTAACMAWNLAAKLTAENE